MVTALGPGKQKSLGLLQRKSPEQELQMTLLLRAVLLSSLLGT